MGCEGYAEVGERALRGRVTTLTREERMLETIIVGAGQAGLGMSQHLCRRGVEHVVLERGRVGETWRSQRWDSFALNTPSWMNRLPGDDDGGSPPDGFQLRDAFVDRLERYAEHHRLPVRTGVTVTAVDPLPAGGGFAAHVDGWTDHGLRARTVVVAAGLQNAAAVPSFAAGLPRDAVQLHAGEYRNPAALPPGAVLVVGSGQSGVQIVEDLLDGGRPVYLSTSRVPRLRRRHRGRDILEWLVPAGFFAMRPEQLPDPAMLSARQPTVSGVGRHGRTVSLQGLAGRGAILLGRIRSIAGDRVLLDDTVAANVRFGDESSAEAARQIDAALTARGLPLPPLEDDPADVPHPDPAALHSPPELDLDAAGIGSIVWTTGFAGDLRWLPSGAFDERGAPIHEGGVSPISGLYHLGFPWLVTRGSGLIHGIDEDAAAITEHLTDTLAAAGR